MADHEFYDDFHLYYDRINAAREAEHAYYRQVLSPRDSVLEVACGSGTLTATFAGICSDVVGVDISERMLWLARARLPQVPFHCCDMRDFDLGRRFSRVICAFNSLMHMLSDSDALAALRRCRAHCLPDGEVILDIFDIAPRFIAAASSDVLVMDAVDPASGRHLRAFEDSAFDSVTGILRVTLRLQEGATGQELMRSSTAMRFYTPAELAVLLDAAGLDVLRIEPNHARDPAQPRARQIVHARPAPTSRRRMAVPRSDTTYRKETA
jgi:SAM-dependent methyltransferase